MAKNIIEPSARVKDIASAITCECNTLRGSLSDMADAMEARDAASVAQSSTRIAVAARIAALSDSEQWTAGEVAFACNHAATQAKEGNNNPDDERTAKSLGVFISEMKTFACPKVRAQFPTIHDACKAAWDDEEMMKATAETKEDRANLDLPVHRWQSRFYHLVMNIARAVKDGTLAVGGMADIVAHANANDPNHNEKKIAARLATIIDNLEKMHKDFPLAEMAEAANFLRTITTKELIAARANREDREDMTDDTGDVDDIIAPVSNTPVVKVSPVVVTITKPAPAPVVPVTAAPSAVDDLLNDIPSYPTSNVTMELAAMCFGRG